MSKIPSKTCPKCGYKGPMETAIRKRGTKKVSGVKVSIVDVGFRCPKCKREWGFEMGRGLSESGGVQAAKVEKRLRREGYSEKAIREILKWYE